MNKLRTMTSIIIAISLLLINFASVSAVPPLPSSFWGTVKINGANVETGTKVTAWINGVKYSETTVLLDEGNTVFSLDIPGDDSATAGVVEGGVAGNTVVFHIGDLVATPTGIWASGTNVEINISAHVNSAPVIAEGESIIRTMSEEGSPISFNLLLHASDVDGDTITWSILTAAQHGLATATGSGTNKTIGYTPYENFFGSDSFVVQVEDGNDGSDQITVNVTVENVNDAPVIAEGSVVEVSMSEDGTPVAFALTLHAADPDPGDILTWSIATAATNGTASASGTGSSKAIGYTPTSGFAGKDSFVVQVADGNDGTDTITVNVTIAEDMADLELSLSSSDAVVIIGNNYSYTVTVKNNGFETASSLILHVTLPDGVEYLGIPSPQWSCVVNGSQIDCTRPSLASGDSTSLIIEVKAPTFTGSLKALANVSNSTYDPDLTNNSAELYVGCIIDPVTGGIYYYIPIISKP